MRQQFMCSNRHSAEPKIKNKRNHPVCPLAYHSEPDQNISDKLRIADVFSKVTLLRFAVRDGKNTQKNYTKKILMTQTPTVVSSHN